MCIINFHLNEHPNYKLIIAANRDEFFNRPTKEAHFWPDAPNLLAGQDLEQQGTWLGITKEGRFAALTNYRDLAHMSKDKKTRGSLISNYLMSNTSADQYIQSIQAMKNDFNGFNLLVGDIDGLLYYNNIENEKAIVENGTHSLSNKFLNTPWPKVTLGRNSLQKYVSENEIVDPNDLFQLLLNDEIAPDETLPRTGIDLELERQVSPIFINTEQYGTRSSTVLLVTKDNEVTFIERSYHQGQFLNERNYTFSI